CALYYSSDLKNEGADAMVFGPLGPESRHGANGSRYALAALLSSVVGLTDDKGAVVGSTDFDPWGRKVNAQGEDWGYGFGGERQDPLAGVVLLRARVYQPQSER